MSLIFQAIHQMYLDTTDVIEVEIDDITQIPTQDDLESRFFVL